MSLARAARWALRLNDLRWLAVIVIPIIFVSSALGAEKTIHVRLDGDLKGEAGTAATKADGVRFGDGHEGQAAIVHRPATLAYPTGGFNTDAFTISFWVRHEKRLEDYFYRRRLSLRVAPTPPIPLPARCHAQHPQGSRDPLVSAVTLTGRNSHAHSIAPQYSFSERHVNWIARSPTISYGVPAPSRRRSSAPFVCTLLRIGFALIRPRPVGWSYE